eukprot:c15938_g1_i1.p1 GENE.c15938_g1_i1~~c15938_g1_i1.p1  ORF type:complete len:180 (+),score=44.88 c15938_g1_i1:92-631(+)
MMQYSHVHHLVELLSFVAKQNQMITRSAYSNPHPEPLGALINRLNQYVRCSPSCYVVALLYMDRLLQQNRDIVMTLDTVQLLFTTSLLISNQYLDDQPELTLQFARIARISPANLANLKTDFLFRIKFSLSFTQSELLSYSDKLCGPLHTEQILFDWSGSPTKKTQEQQTERKPHQHQH